MWRVRLPVASTTSRLARGLPDRLVRLRSNLRRRFSDHALELLELREGFGDSSETDDAAHEEILARAWARLRQYASREWNRIAEQPADERIFISYAHEDAAAARRIAEALESHRYMPWIDQDGVRAGQYLEPTIDGAIQASSSVIVLLSRLFEH